MSNAKQNFSHWDFPVKRDPFVSENKIIESYVSERSEIKSAADLISFTERWFAVWKTEFSKELPEVSSHEKVLNHITEILGNTPISKEPSNEEIFAIEVIAPTLFVRAEVAATHFGVDTDIVFDQMFHEETMKKELPWS